MFRSYLGSPALFAALFVGAVTFPSSLVAQSSAGTQPDGAGAQATAMKDLASAPPGPRSAPAGIATPVQASAVGHPRRGYDMSHGGTGTNLALVGLGAAAMVTGAIIGGSGGTGVMVVGVSVGVYGLYHLLR